MVVGAQRLLPALQQVIGEGLQFGGHTVMMHLVPIVLVLPSCQLHKGRVMSIGMVLMQQLLHSPC